MCCVIFKKEKTSVHARKKRGPKGRKSDIFSNWFFHGFGPKLAIFPPFFGNIGQENVLYDILEQKKRIS